MIEDIINNLCNEIGIQPPTDLQRFFLFNMNSYELSRKWFDFSFSNPDKIKPIHSAVYFFAIEHCNRLGWKDKFGFPSQMVMEAIGVKNWRTYSKALNDLVEWGFIQMIEISKNQYSSNIIAIVKNTKAQSKALDKALQKHGTKQRQSTVSIDKQLNNKQETIKQYSQNVLQTFDDCLKYFDDHLHPKSKKQSDKWKDTIDKLNRIENIPFENIVDIVRNTRDDLFWAKNFLSLNKLRQKDKNGIMYVVKFNEQIKSNAKNKRTNSSKQAVSDERLAEIYSKVFADKKK